MNLRCWKCSTQLWGLSRDFYKNFGALLGASRRGQGGAPGALLYAAECFAPQRGSALARLLLRVARSVPRRWHTSCIGCGVQVPCQSRLGIGLATLARARGDSSLARPLQRAARPCESFFRSHNMLRANALHAFRILFPHTLRKSAVKQMSTRCAQTS